jgi:hypothetical protein
MENYINTIQSTKLFIISLSTLLRVMRIKVVFELAPALERG